MKFLRTIAAKIRSYYANHPKLATAISLVLFFIIFCGIEASRAAWYSRTVGSYKNSAAVMEMRDTVDKISRSATITRSAYLCDIALENLTPQLDQESIEFSQENNHLQVLVPKVHDQIATLKTAPKFYSLAVFLPQVKAAKKQSSELEQARTKLSLLTKPDARSDYCTALEEALIKVYFIMTLQKPEGVEALFPGQLENFQVVVQQSQEEAQKLSYPTKYEQEHLAINKLLVQLEKDLKTNDNNTVAFSRRIEQNVLQLNDELNMLQQKAEDLSRLPGELLVFAEAFVNK